MPNFSVRISNYEITACIQVQTVIVLAPTRVKIDGKGNGSISLSAANPDEAMNLAMEYLKTSKDR
jgi:hypothetical protein